MKKPIKIHLQYPWKFPDSPYYKYLIDNPPEGIKYINEEKPKGVIINKKFFWFSNFLKKNIRKSLNILNISIPNARLSPRGNYDLIHCAHCLSLNKDTPWVADIESFWQFWISMKQGAIGKYGVKKILLSKNCKKIMPWTETIKKDIQKIFPEIKDKLEVVPPAVTFTEFGKKKSKKVTLLYSSRYFWMKGGLVALESLRRIKKKFDINTIFISYVPENLKREYNEINILEVVSQEKLKELYKEADIFFYPSFIDTFGFSLLEAMSYGLPVVTVNTGGTTNCKEIIEDKKTGFIVDFPYYKGNEIYDKCYSIGKEEEKLINQLVERASLLIENKKLRKKMGENCIKEIKSGKFSIKKRNRKLKKIYQEALK